MPSPLNRQLAAGKPAAFAELYDAVADSVYHYLLVQTGSPADAADLLQESFLRIYRSHKKLAEVENLRAYVFHVARNENRRRLNRNRPLQLEASLLFDLETRPQPHSVEQAELITVALMRLPDHFREVIELKFFAQLSFKEIASVTGNPPGTIATWYRRALKQMRNQNPEAAYDR